LRCGCAKSDDEPWAYGFDFVKQPVPAYLDFAGVRAFVQAPLAARLKLEMFDRVGHVNALAIDAGLRERPIQQEAGRSDKWPALAIFVVSGLFADKHDLRVRRAFSEYRPGRIFP
jgi:hypothetical protein